MRLRAMHRLSLCIARQADGAAERPGRALAGGLCACIALDGPQLEQARRAGLPSMQRCTALSALHGAAPLGVWIRGPRAR